VQYVCEDDQLESPSWDDHSQVAVLESELGLFALQPLAPFSLQALGSQGIRRS